MTQSADSGYTYFITFFNSGFHQWRIGSDSGAKQRRCLFQADVIGNADRKVYPQIQVIKASEVNDAWAKVLDKKARYRFVIDAATI